MLRLTDWIKGSEKITQKLENINDTENTVELVVFSINKTEITIFSINKIEIIQKKLEQLYSEDRPAFIVNKHSEQKRGKSRMVIHQKYLLS